MTADKRSVKVAAAGPTSLLGVTSAIQRRLPSWQEGMLDIVKRALVTNVSATNAVLSEAG
jgi:hypothetical protein